MILLYTFSWSGEDILIICGVCSQRYVCREESAKILDRTMTDDQAPKEKIFHLF